MRSGSLDRVPNFRGLALCLQEDKRALRCAVPRSPATVIRGARFSCCVVRRTRSNRCAHSERWPKSTLRQFGACSARDRITSVAGRREQGEEVALLAMIDSLYPDRSGGARKPTRTEQRKFERLVLDEPAPLPERYAEGRTLHEIFLEYWLEYSPRPYDGKITMFMADKQLSRMRDALAVVRGEMKRGPFGKARRALRTAERIERMSPLRWRGVAEGGIELISVPGSHAEMIRGQGAAQIAQALGERMP